MRMKLFPKSVAILCVLSLLLSLTAPLNGVVLAASARPDKSSIGVVVAT